MDQQNGWTKRLSNGNGNKLKRLTRMIEIFPIKLNYKPKLPTGVSIASAELL
jgi:hypothetical protein